MNKDTRFHVDETLLVHDQLFFLGKPLHHPVETGWDGLAHFYSYEEGGNGKDTSLFAREAVMADTGKIVVKNCDCHEQSLLPVFLFHMKVEYALDGVSPIMGT